MKKNKEQVVKSLAIAMSNSSRPFLLFSGASGTGKTWSAQLLSKVLGYSVVDSFDKLENSRAMFSNQPVLVMLEELQGKKRSFQENVLEKMNEIEESNGFMVFTNPSNMVTAKKQIMIVICTTDKYKVLDPIVRRCTIVDYPEYTLEEIKEIVIGYYPKVDVKIIDRVINCCKLDIRTALSLVEQYLLFHDLDQVLEIRYIDNFGLTQNDKKYLFSLKNRGKMSVDELTSVLSLPSNNCVKKEIEPYFKKMGWVSTETKGRCLTEEGKKLIETLQADMLEQQEKERLADEIN